MEDQTVEKDSGTARAVVVDITTADGAAVSGRKRKARESYSDRLPSEKVDPVLERVAAGDLSISDAAKALNVPYPCIRYRMDREKYKNINKEYREGHAEEIAERARLYALEHNVEVRERKAVYERHRKEVLSELEQDIAEIEKDVSDAGAIEKILDAQERVGNKLDKRWRNEQNAAIAAHLHRSGVFSDAEATACRARKRVRGKREHAFMPLDAGCTVEEFVVHIKNTAPEELKNLSDSAFWALWGKKNGFEIDHILPKAYFDKTDEDELWYMNYYRNQRAVWSFENRRKSDYMDIKRTVRARDLLKIRLFAKMSENTALLEYDRAQETQCGHLSDGMALFEKVRSSRESYMAARDQWHVLFLKEMDAEGALDQAAHLEKMQSHTGKVDGLTRSAFRRKIKALSAERDIVSTKLQHLRLYRNSLEVLMAEADLEFELSNLRGAELHQNTIIAERHLWRMRDYREDREREGVAGVFGDGARQGSNLNDLITAYHSWWHRRRPYYASFDGYSNACRYVEEVLSMFLEYSIEKIEDAKAKVTSTAAWLSTRVEDTYCGQLVHGELLFKWVSESGWDWWEREEPTEQEVKYFNSTAVAEYREEEMTWQEANPNIPNTRSNRMSDPTYPKNPLLRVEQITEFEALRRLSYVKLRAEEIRKKQNGVRTCCIASWEEHGRVTEDTMLTNIEVLSLSGV